MDILDEFQSERPMQYAGFWIRFVAYVIDGLILGAVLTPIFMMFFGMSAFMASDVSDDPAMVLSAMAGMSGFMVLEFVAAMFYFALMQSSKYQATLGKMAVGIIVIDENGGRISFGKAVGRFFGKILSGLILYIGFIMAGFDSRKQALHDKIAGTFVIYKNR